MSRLVVINVVTIEEFRTKALKAVDKYLQMPIDERKPCMFVLDSLGMLSTEKEIRDALDDKQVRDMTKSQLVKGAFRMLTLKLGQANIPLIVTNHTYDVIGSYIPTKEMGGGSGLKYAASTIIYLGKKKEREGKETVGNIIKAKTHKSRLSKENKEVEIRLFYYDERGLDRYYGLTLSWGKIGGLWKKRCWNRYEIGDGKKLYAKQHLSPIPTPILLQEVLTGTRRDVPRRSLVMDLNWYAQANSPYNDGWVREYYQGLIDEEYKDSKEGDRCKESTQAT